MSLRELTLDELDAVTGGTGSCDCECKPKEHPHGGPPGKDKDCK
jgi:hypothetical protein